MASYPAGHERLSLPFLRLSSGQFLHSRKLQDTSSRVYGLFLDQGRLWPNQYWPQKASWPCASVGWRRRISRDPVSPRLSGYCGCCSRGCGINGIKWLISCGLRRSRDGTPERFVSTGRRKSRGRCGRPPIAKKMRNMIRKLSSLVRNTQNTRLTRVTERSNRM